MPACSHTPPWSSRPGGTGASELHHGGLQCGLQIARPRERGMTWLARERSRSEFPCDGPSQTPWAGCPMSLNFPDLPPRRARSLPTFRPLRWRSRPLAGPPSAASAKPTCDSIRKVQTCPQLLFLSVSLPVRFSSNVSPQMDPRELQSDRLPVLQRQPSPSMPVHFEPADTFDSPEYPIKRRRTKETSRTMRVDAHRLCAFAIAADIDLFGHLARTHHALTSELAAVTGVEASLLDSIVHTLAADGWLDEIGAEHFAANQVTHAMSDPDFQSLVAHCYEMGLPVALATPRFLNSINFKEPQDASLMAWHVSKARTSGFFDYFTRVDT